MKSFGTEIKEDFLIEPGYVCINHASYGIIPKHIFEYKYEQSKIAQQNPDKFLRFEWHQLCEELRLEAADFLGAEKNQCFFANNATEAFNSIIRNIKFTNDDKILYTNLTYEMVQKTINFVCDLSGAQPIKIIFTQEDLSVEKILQKFEEKLKKLKIKVAVIDNITSMPSIKMPVKKLIELCKKYDTICILDAAHGVGISQINLKELDPDFFLTNFNKWAFCPMGLNLLYMKEKYLDQIHHTIISNTYGNGLDQEFQICGTADKSHFLTVKEGIKFIKAYGLTKIINYCESLAYQGAKLIANIWNTDLLVEDKEMSSAMVMIRVPHDDITHVYQCQKKCSDEYNVIFVFTQFDQKVWARIAASVYNTINDYEYAGKSFLSVLQKEE